MIQQSKRKLIRPFSVFFLLLVGLVGVFSLTTIFPRLGFDIRGSANMTESVIIQPGQSISDIVKASSENTTFYIKPGIYREESIVPKQGQKFIGESGVVLSGARVVNNFVKEGNYWVASGQTQEGQRIGECFTDAPRCNYPEDLFFNNIPFKHVSSLVDVTANTWYLDYQNDKMYIANDPTNQLVEASVTRYAFHCGDPSSTNNCNDVAIRNLVIEKYANPAQHGAIHAMKGTNGSLTNNWRIISNEIRHNHGAGVVLGNATLLQKNRIHNNGQIGIRGGGKNDRVEENVISNNNRARYKSGWEAGGTKFTTTTGLMVIGNTSFDNDGPGFWTDIDNIDTTYENNTVYSNKGPGIFHEISYKALIKNNVVKNNGLNNNAWVWDAQILLSNSSDVEVTGNTVVVSPTAGNGITIAYLDRGSGIYGPRVSKNNYVHHNDITYLGAKGVSGGSAIIDKTTFTTTNRFDYNTYHVTDLVTPHWFWLVSKDWQGFSKSGQELNGSVDTAISQ